MSMKNGQDQVHIYIHEWFYFSLVLTYHFHHVSCWWLAGDLSQGNGLPEAIVGVDYSLLLERRQSSRSLKERKKSCRADVSDNVTKTSWNSFCV